MKFRTKGKPVSGPDFSKSDLIPAIAQDIETGDVLIVREPDSNTEAHGTELKLLDLLPRTRRGWCSRQA